MTCALAECRVGRHFSPPKILAWRL